MRLDPREPVYHRVTIHPGSIEGFGFRIAEVSVHTGRQHRRLIGFAPGTNSPIHGRAILYSDTYRSTRGETTFVYSRHRARPADFLKELNLWIQEELEDAPELRGRSFPVWANIAGNAAELDVEPPFVAPGNIPAGPGHEINFLRVELPYGALTVEFATENMEGNWGFRDLDFLPSGLLPRRIVGPLIGCDLSKSNSLRKLVAKLHWAAKSIPVRILEEMIDEVTQTAVPA